MLAVAILLATLVMKELINIIIMIITTTLLPAKNGPQVAAIHAVMPVDSALNALATANAPATK